VSYGYKAVLAAKRLEKRIPEFKKLVTEGNQQAWWMVEQEVADKRGW